MMDEKLNELLYQVFRQDFLVDEHRFVFTQALHGKEIKIPVITTHAVFIRNVGTGRVRLFDGLWLLPGEFYRDENQHYRKYGRDIDCLLADTVNDPENYENNAPAIKTHEVFVLVKKVLSK